MSGESVLVRALELSDLDGLLALYSDIGLVKPEDSRAQKAHGQAGRRLSRYVGLRPPTDSPGTLTTDEMEP